MIKNLSKAITLTAMLFSAQTFAQQIEKGLPGMYPKSVDFTTSPQKFVKNAIVLVDDNGNTVANNSILIRADKDELSYTHYRYQQTYLGLPVEHATYVLHVKGDEIISENGKWIKDFSASLKAAPMLSKDDALHAAIAEVGANEYKWQVAVEENLLKQDNNDNTATYYPKPTLVFYGGEEEVTPENVRLAYKMDIYAAYPVSRNIIFVDAINGSILGKREIIHTVNAPGTAVTAYSGSQSITTDQVSSTSYRLRETGRGNGIQTFNMANAGANYANAVDFVDADNNWNNVNTAKDQYATDAHWGAEKTYDYYFSRYNRNSVNNAGLLLKSYVHTSLIAQGYPDNVNAFWDGSRMSYGDGNATYKPLTALDIAGHEITHAVTQYSSNLTYSTESGAMNEGFSDIFGTAIEFYARPSRANWLIGEDISAPFRSMSNPNSYSQPDTYLGTYWYSGTADNGGVHTNSGVLNYWFYLLSVGGSGTNDKGTAYNVTGIGIDKAGAIAYRLNTFYLISTSKYADARTSGIKAAEDLYGVGSVEATQTANAWTAVGVGAATTPTCSDTYEANETRTAAKAITTNVDVTARIGSSTDKDWFTFTTTSSAPKVQITLTNLVADYDVALYNSAGTQLGISQNSSTTAETIKYNSSTVAATYYVQVFGYNGANSTSCYKLRASTSGINFITATEPNGIAGSKNVNNQIFTAYPSPVASAGTIALQFTSEESIAKQIVITDVMGKNVFAKQIAAVKGTNNISVKLPSVAPGTYFIRVDEKNIKKISIF